MLPTVTDAIHRAAGLEGIQVQVQGTLHFGLETRALMHAPVSDGAELHQAEVRALGP
ncbi:MAG: hypothetical protein MUF57_08205 [Gammaproteobacteria bacterium]|jgi:hypothetical protein|nr:hypothetical protein [Gammaproteobacteria bacterium]